MYSAFLLIHNLLRWLVILAGLIAVARAIGGIRGRRDWLPADSAAVRWFGISMDVQFLIGLLLYVWLSPFIRDAWADIGATMRNAPLRFFAVEHLFGMLVAVTLVNIGRAKIKRASEAARKHKLAAIFFGIAIVIILLSIPWPGTPGGRPLLRGIGGQP
jgi:Na+-driven multidrug efflux pump